MSSIGSRGPDSWHAQLIQAAGKGNESKVRELITDVSPLEQIFNDAVRIAFQRVVGRGHEALTRLMLESGAAVNVVLEGEVPPLHRAAELGRDKIVRTLLEFGAFVDMRDKNMRTAIFPAAQKNHGMTLKLLLDAGAGVNVQDEDGQNLMLYLAAETSEKLQKWGNQIIEMLLNTAIDLEVKDKDGRTALLWAVATGKEALAKLLLTARKQNIADIQATNNRGKTALHLAIESKTNRAGLVRLLLDEGADVNAQSDGGWTPLHNAAEKGYADVALLLLQEKARVNAETSSRMTALHWCARNGHIDLVRLLMQQPGVQKYPKDAFEETPMLGAAQNGHIEIVRLLSPADDGASLSPTAHAACKGFQATIVDFGMEHRPMNHRKHSVFDVLYGWDVHRQKPIVTTLVRNIPAKPTFRWIHLPTNNLAWAETLITKHFVENSVSDIEGFKAIEKTLAQQHRGSTVHSSFMRPLCQRMQPTKKDTAVSYTSDTLTEDTAVETKTPKPTIVLPGQENAPLGERKTDRKPTLNERKVKNTSIPQGSTLPPKAPRRQKEGARLDSAPRRKGDKSAIQGRTTIDKKASRNGNIVLFMPYLHYETHRNRVKMSEAINRATTASDNMGRSNLSNTCDEMLIQAYLKSTPNLHIRRTLDQFYYHAINTEYRDMDQVVYRYTRGKGKDTDTKLVMVDQLWLWILDNDLIVTSFPQRWKQPKNDPLNVLDGIIEDMNSKTRPPVKSVYDLATLITGRCSGVFDRHRLGNEDYQFLDMFESSIGQVVRPLRNNAPVFADENLQTNEETELFRDFNKASQAAARWLTDQRARGKSQFSDKSSSESDSNKDIVVDTLLDIGKETALLAETKDIRDELNMISMVLKHQISVLDDMTHALLEEAEGSHNQQMQSEIKKRSKEQHKVVDVHLKDVERMDKQAEGIYTSVCLCQYPPRPQRLILTVNPPPRLEAKARQCFRSSICKRSSHLYRATRPNYYGFYHCDYCIPSNVLHRRCLCYPCPGLPA